MDRNEQFERIAIVNRGEPAMRLIRAIREFNREHATSLRTIALFTAPDRKSMFVREADESYDLGEPTFVDESDGRTKSSYLDRSRLERALVATGAEAAWVGWGFVAEHADFVDLCDRLGVVFIGPSAEVMRLLGDKISSKLIAEKAGVPVAPWSGGPVPDVAAAHSEADLLGYPIMIKASAGGGGRGIRRVTGPEDLEESFQSAASEATKAFGDGTLFMERMVQGARHIEVQMVGDASGTVWGLGVRDCSVQRRNQKVLEEAPSPALSEEQDRDLRAAAVRLGAAAGYVGAGTVEFLYDEATRAFYFMEVNARLQVEHPITELTTGADLVKLQLLVARGGSLPAEPPPTRGHAIEARLNAEDPDRRFAPAPGHIDIFRTATGPGVRIDTGVEEGDEVAPQFDSMIAKVIGYGADRNEALARLGRALADTTVVIRDGASNKAFLQQLLDTTEVKTGKVDVGWLDRIAGQDIERPHADVALLQAAVDAYDAEIKVEKARFRASALRGRPEVGDEAMPPVELQYRGQKYEFTVRRLDPQRYRILIDGVETEVSIDRVGPYDARLTWGGHTYRIVTVPHGLRHFVEVNGVPHHVSPDRGGVVRAQSPAVVVSVAVSPGDRVAVGDRLAVLEAMKMEMAVLAEFAGTVREVHVRANVQVPAGTSLLTIDPSGEEEQIAASGRIRFDGVRSSSTADHGGARCAHVFEDVRRMMMGYDVDPAVLNRRISATGSLCDDVPADDLAMRDMENDVLRIFVDVVSLFRRRPPEVDEEEDMRRSSEEYLFAYLRDVDGRGEGLPESFLEKLRRALSHYGVDGLERTDLLDNSLFRLTKSYQRMDRQLAPIVAILERRLDVPAEEYADASRRLLDRLISESYGRYGLIHDVAREVHYRAFDQPFLDEVRNLVFQEAAMDLSYLMVYPDGPERAERMERLIECPQPLKVVLASAHDEAPPATRRALLEVMVRRYYRIRDLENVHHVESNGVAFTAAEYTYEGRRIYLFAAHGHPDDFDRVVAAAAPLAAAAPDDVDVVCDYYLWDPVGPPPPEQMAPVLLEVVNAHAGSRRLRRVAVAVSSKTAGWGMGALEHFTFRPGDDGYHEERLYRGLHPMMAKRLELWRLQNFEIERVPSVEDVYVFFGVARENQRDRRLFVLAEVRDVTPIRDQEGRVVHLPELERVFMESIASIRRYQSRLAPRDRLHWNRMLLYIWPPLDLRSDELASLAQRMAPATEGLGLEKVVVNARLVVPGETNPRQSVFEISNPGGRGLALRLREPRSEPLEPLDEYTQQVVRLRQRGLVYPYEIVHMLTPSDPDPATGIPAGGFVEYDLDDGMNLVPVERPYGKNGANMVVGVITNYTAKHPEGMSRVMLIGDPSRGMGSLAEPECRRINAAIALARELQVPLEWFAVSAGALISMESGTENMDWIGAVLRELILFTQDGGEVNVVVTGINVGAQPYWNAEATMLMHTKGVLIMTDEGAMVLTGKQALDYSGGVSAEDNQGIGGYERIMGPNGQAQYYARDVGAACGVLLRHYEHSYVAPGERFPRRAFTTDPADRDVRPYPHGNEFDTVGEVFSEEANPGRKRPFDIRRVMSAVVDQDHEPLERWYAMEDAEVAVVWDAHVGGYPVCMLGFESRPLARLGYVPADGPDAWTSGTLFPQASRKVARAVNAASGDRPLVVLANLSGFDGSPESMRNWQLEYGAEIGRAVTNFDGPIVFVVVSRYHGGAFVVFSTALNESMEVAAIEGSFASVIGGAPAAAVVFAREVDRRVAADERIVSLEEESRRAEGAERTRLVSRLADVRNEVRSEKLGQVAAEFDTVHSIHRALEVGSVHRIIAPQDLRPYVIDAVERGMARSLSGPGDPE